MRWSIGRSTQPCGSFDGTSTPRSSERFCSDVMRPAASVDAAGGAADFQMTADSFGSLKHWSVALTVIIVALLVKFRTSGALSNAAILTGLLAGYALAYMLGMVSFGGVAKASMITNLQVMPYGFEFNLGAVIAVTLISIVSAVETVGDASATTKAGAGRTATDEEISGATYADGLGTAVAGVFGGLPNTSFSQNVGIVGMTGVMSRHVIHIETQSRSTTSTAELANCG